MIEQVVLTKTEYNELLKYVSMTKISKKIIDIFNHNKFFSQNFCKDNIFDWYAFMNQADNSSFKKDIFDLLLEFKSIYLECKHMTENQK